MSLPFLAAADVAERLSPTAAIDALEAALRSGLDPEADPPRGALAVGGGELLVMPSATAAHAVVKLVTVGGEPRIQGVCVVFDATTLAPVALVDGIALTNVRTPAVSALAVRALAAPDARRLLVFGRGPQAHGHVEAIRAVRPIEHVDMVGRDGHGVDALVAAADVICCATTARAPLFDGSLVADHATVVAIGSHEPDARETDDALAAPRDRRGRVAHVRAARGGRRHRRDRGRGAARGRARGAGGRRVRSGGRRSGAARGLFKSTGMAWEDAVVASALVR